MRISLPHTFQGDSQFIIILTASPFWKSLVRTAEPFYGTTGGASGLSRLIKHRISWHQAARIEYAMLERYDNHRGPLRTIHWLGVDEICFGKMKNMYTIVSDLEKSAVIGVVEGHQTISLDSFFTVAGKPFCESVRVVCMDMWKAYRASVTGFCTNAKIIFDKFHVIRHLNDAIDEIRRKEFFRQGGEKRELVRGKRWLFLRRWFNLTIEQKGLLKETLALNKRLSVAYYLKEIFGSL